MTYQHHFEDGTTAKLPAGKVVCVGRNYREHAKELNNPVPDSPLLFIKPATSLTALAPSFSLVKNQGEVHHELELALLIGQQLSRANPTESIAAIVGIGLALDLTLRDVQQQLKEKSQPWEIAKGFDGACPVSNFIKPELIDDLQNASLSLTINGHVQQSGNTKEMLFPIAQLLATISTHFTLLPGDIVLTGTPAGVGPLCCGDQLTLQLEHLLTVNCSVE